MQASFSSLCDAESFEPLQVQVELEIVDVSRVKLKEGLHIPPSIGFTVCCEETISSSLTVIFNSLGHS